ncbi:Crp/Fnr family transcriptional regulator [Microvirgula aerodenitrificans]|nr:Crp/Fnr family transcriptional regulator [Microvirgula aerodenitrificans]
MPDVPSLPLLSGHPLFRSQPATVLDALALGASVRRVAAGGQLFREGDPAGHYYLVISGSVEMLRYGQDGEERVFRLYERGQLVAIAAMFMAHARYPMNARARTDLAVHRLSRAALHQVCAAHPDIAMRLLEVVSQQLYQHVNQVDWLTGSSASQRLAAYLLGLPRTADSTAVQLPLSQRQLAAHLGVRAETLSRLLSEWTQRGLVRGRQRTWALCDIVPLQRLASASSRPF